MAREVIRRNAADNVYLHQDFHGAMSAGLAYLKQHYGAAAVRDYLRQFALTYYSAVTRAMQERGLVALREHVERIYQLEQGQVNITFSEDEMQVQVEACPAVAHMRQHGYAVAPLFHETSRTVYAAICEGTPFVSEWLAHDEQSGRAVVRFYRRLP
jgi:HSP90 family molecular chaperone